MLAKPPKVEHLQPECDAGEVCVSRRPGSTFSIRILISFSRRIRNLINALNQRATEENWIRRNGLKRATRYERHPSTKWATNLFLKARFIDWIWIILGNPFYTSISFGWITEIHIYILTSAIFIFILNTRKILRLFQAEISSRPKNNLTAIFAMNSLMIEFHQGSTTRFRLSYFYGDVCPVLFLSTPVPISRTTGELL